MVNFKVLNDIHISKISEEWDNLAPVRLKQILSGSDITFNHIMLPNVLDLLEEEKKNSILDAGCGVGVLTSYLTNEFSNVIGIDPSRKSLELAEKTTDGEAAFAWSSIEQFSSMTGQRFDVIVANMVLMDAPNVNTFLTSSYKLLKPGGSFIFSITHPCFWPSYYGYAGEDWYEYNKEIIIESPFRISSEPNCRILSTHIHRPIAQYSEALHRSGLTIEILLEPMPDESVQKLYPTRWKFPHYLIGRCRRQKRIT